MSTAYCSSELSPCTDYDIDKDSSWKYIKIPSWEDRYETWAGVMEDYRRTIRPTTVWHTISWERAYWINSQHIESFVELYNRTRSSDEKNELKLVFQFIASNWNENSHVEAFANGKKVWGKSLLPQDCWNIDPKTVDETRRNVRDKIQKLIRQRRHLEAADGLHAWDCILPNIYELYQELEES